MLRRRAMCAGGHATAVRHPSPGAVAVRALGVAAVAAGAAAKAQVHLEAAVAPLLLLLKAHQVH